MPDQLPGADVARSFLLLPVFVLACGFLAACSKHDPPPTPSAKSLSITNAGQPVAKQIDFNEEPPESVLRGFMFHQYALLEAAGGLPVTLTATGKSGTLRARLYEVRKDDCKRQIIEPKDVWECSVNLKVDMWWDGRPEPGKPGDDNKRISVIKDENGVWVDCSFQNGRGSICERGRKLR